ncbi:MAG: hypothetical protein NMNS01_17470 [Nitrosomonas sp.]|nr:MAG: hypothetical protein NMNS01_17470 [Nitrosomonas sp.]
MSTSITINLASFYNNTAKLEQLDNYKRKAIEQAGEGEDIILTGAAPVWLYLAIAHALHGKAKKLIYDSPVTGEIVIFDHSPF